MQYITRVHIYIYFSVVAMLCKAKVHGQESICTRTVNLQCSL